VKSEQTKDQLALILSKEEERRVQEIKKKSMSKREQVERNQEQKALDLQPNLEIQYEHSECSSEENRTQSEDQFKPD